MIYRAKRIGRGAPKAGMNKMGLLRRKIKQTYPDNWEELRIRIFERDNWTCRRCGASLRGKASRQVHHILNLANGGSNHPRNLVSLCGPCHHKQHGH